MNGKYRGKDIKTGKWVYGWFCIWQGISLIFDSPFNLYNNPVEVIPESVGQWIGPKDKNGVDAYAGDIIDDEEFGIMRLAWCDLELCFAGYDKLGFFTRVSAFSNPTIIGNTTDNPELLKD
jgi:hypothetical protein